MWLRLGCSLIVVLTACAGQTAPPPSPSQEPAEAEETGRVATPAGATLRVPDGFRAERDGEVVRLIEPDGRVDVWLVETEVAGRALEAVVADAWARVRPGFEAAVDRTRTPPASGGWDAVSITDYAPAEDGALAQAVARVVGGRAWVSLVRGPRGALDKRRAQIRAFLGSLDAPGVKKRDLSGVTARSIGSSLEALDAFIAAALEGAGAPGLSIAVVERGRVVFERGYGVLELGSEAPVTPETLMMIGSVSKSMTTLMMATLVDDGVLDWDAPVTSVYPDFRVDDEALTEALEVEHLVCACAGLPRKDLPLVLEFEGKAPEDVFSALAEMAPSTGLKETFQYQNQMVVAGGYVAAHAASKAGEPLDRAYRRLMRARIFEPMGLTRTTLDHDAAVAAENRATPHATDLERRHHVVDLEHERFASLNAPSGGIWSTARDLARYVITELARGEAPGGARVASEENLTRRWAPQVAIGTDVHYGLGWVVSEAQGLRMVQHGGGTMGFATHVSFYPDKGVGVAMISNGSGGHAAEALIRARLRELWFGAEVKAEARLEHLEAQTAEDVAELKERIGPPDPEMMRDLLGPHTHPEVGDITIEKDGDTYRLDAGEYQTRLVRYHRPDGEAALMFADPPLAGLRLIPVPAKLGTFEMTRGQERYVFTRK